MLGRLLEFSVTADPIAPALAFYRALGFQELAGGDWLDQPRVVVWDGQICIGLSGRGLPGTTLTFVRPNLADHLRALRRHGIELESAQLGDDRFNEASFADPNGQRVRLLEARTHSPGGWDRSKVSACGDFAEYSVATHAIDDSIAFWSRLGFDEIARGGQKRPWARMRGCGLSIGFHQCAGFRAALSYRSSKLPARLEYLGAKKLEPRPGSPLTARTADSATLLAPDGTRLFLLAENVA